MLQKFRSLYKSAVAFRVSVAVIYIFKKVNVQHKDMILTFSSAFRIVSNHLKLLVKRTPVVQSGKGIAGNQVELKFRVHKKESKGKPLPYDFRLREKDVQHASNQRKKDKGKDRNIAVVVCRPTPTHKYGNKRNCRRKGEKSVGDGNLQRKHNAFSDQVCFRLYVKNKFCDRTGQRDQHIQHERQIADIVQDF